MKTLASFGVALLIALPAHAATLSIDNFTARIGDVIEVPVYASGGEDVTGVQISFGLQGDAAGIEISAFEATNADSIWNNPIDQVNLNAAPTLSGNTVVGVADLAGPVPAAGVVGVFTVDLTGASLGEVVLNPDFAGVPTALRSQFSDANIQPLFPQVEPGRLTIVPEPNSLAWVALAAIAFIRRSQRAKSTR